MIWEASTNKETFVIQLEFERSKLKLNKTPKEKETVKLLLVTMQDATGDKPTTTSDNAKSGTYLRKLDQEGPRAERDTMPPAPAPREAPVAGRAPPPP